jgi:hypothetical protein
MQQSERKKLAKRLREVEVLSKDILKINNLPWIVTAATEMSKQAEFIRNAVETPCICGPTELSPTMQMAN